MATARTAQLCCGKPLLGHGTIPPMVFGFLPPYFILSKPDGILLVFKDVQKPCI